VLGRDLVSLAFPEGCPPSLAPVLEPERLGPGLAHYGGGLILPSTADRPRRFYVANTDPERWRDAVAAGFDSPEVRAWLAGAPRQGRLMLDSDGVSLALYHDDLAGQLLARCTAFPEGHATTLLRHSEWPGEALAPDLRARSQALVQLGLGGMWATRQSGDTTTAVLLMDEAHRQPAQAGVAAQIVSDSLAIPGWDEACALVQRSGYVPFPDGIELREDGSLDITLGIAEPSRLSAD
jgi:hypothetical protein